MADPEVQSAQAVIPLFEGQIISGVLFNEPMQVKSVCEEVASAWMLRLSGVGSEQFCKMTLTVADLVCLDIQNPHFIYQGSEQVLRIGISRQLNRSIVDFSYIYEKWSDVWRSNRCLIRSRTKYGMEWWVLSRKMSGLSPSSFGPCNQRIQTPQRCRTVPNRTKMVKVAMRRQKRRGILLSSTISRSSLRSLLVSIWCAAIAEAHSPQVVTVFDRVHIAMLLNATGQANGLWPMLREETQRGSDFLRFANVFSTLYSKDSDEKRLLDVMLLAVSQ